MNLKPGQTYRSCQMSTDRMLAVARVVRSSPSALMIDQVANAVGLSAQSARRALHRAIALGLVAIKSSGPTGIHARPKHCYEAGARSMPDESSLDIAPAYKVFTSPFAVAAGIVKPTQGASGYVHLMDTPEDELEAA